MIGVISLVIFVTAVISTLIFDLAILLMVLMIIFWDFLDF